MRFRSWQLVGRSFLASFFTSLLVMFQIQSDTYFGSPYSPDIRNGLWVIGVFPMWVLYAIPAFFLITPITTAATLWILEREWRQHWGGWILSGFLLGPPALFLLSFPLGLGRHLWFALTINGMVWGAVCATIMRALLDSEIRNPAIDVDAEQPDGIAIPIL